MVTNPKIEKKKKDIDRTATRFAEVKAKLREQKLELISLENDEIVAMFRKEVITEDDFAALMRSRREAERECENEYDPQAVPVKAAQESQPLKTVQERKEEPI